MELRGIATTGISLVRENTAAMRPPRALWVPFDLGRPLGAPAKSDFQRKVLRAALRLLERKDGPVILEDFPDDAPGQGDPEALEGMVCPVPLRVSAHDSGPGLIGAVLQEISELAPWYELFAQTHARSTVGISDLGPQDAVARLGELLSTGAFGGVDEARWGELLRFVTEDVRNYYFEAAAMRPGGAAAPRELADWFWGETRAGALILALHPVCMGHENDGLRQVAATQLVPRAQRHRLADQDNQGM